MMVNNEFSGVFSALVTPFDHRGELDLDAFADLVLLQKQDGIQGIVVSASTGEAPTLSLSERRQLVEVAKREAGSMVVIAGAGSNCTKNAIVMQKALEDAGADATLQVVPYYNKPTQRGMYEHFLAIGKEASVPIVLYNVPGRTGVDMTPETVADLACEPNIAGIKDANPDMERLNTLLTMTKAARRDFVVLSGEDALFLPTLSLGADGIISVISQIATAEMLSLYRAFRQNELVDAQKIAGKLAGFAKLIFSHTNPIPIKTLLATLGVIKKSFRLPLCALSPEEEQEFLKKCRDFAFIKHLATKGFTS